jgi:hypothetical protein
MDLNNDFNLLKKTKGQKTISELITYVLDRAVLDNLKNLSDITGVDRFPGDAYKTTESETKREAGDGKNSHGTRTLPSKTKLKSETGDVKLVTIYKTAPRKMPHILHAETKVMTPFIVLALANDLASAFDNDESLRSTTANSELSSKMLAASEKNPKSIFPLIFDIVDSSDLDSILEYAPDTKMSQDLSSGIAKCMFEHLYHNTTACSYLGQLVVRFLKVFSVSLSQLLWNNAKQRTDERDGKQYWLTPKKTVTVDILKSFLMTQSILSPMNSEFVSNFDTLYNEYSAEVKEQVLAKKVKDKLASDKRKAEKEATTLEEALAEEQHVDNREPVEEPLEEPVEAPVEEPQATVAAPSRRPTRRRAK